MILFNGSATSLRSESMSWHLKPQSSVQPVLKTKGALLGRFLSNAVCQVRLKTIHRSGASSICTVHGCGAILLLRSATSCSQALVCLPVMGA